MSGNILGFDHGMKRIGVAVGQTITGRARGIAALTARDGIPDWQQVEKLIKDWQATRVVVGLPLNMDDTEQQMTHAARRFGNRLAQWFEVPVSFVDERLSTHEALSRMGIRDKMQSDKRGDVDKLSAEIILQSWLDQQ